MTELELNGQPPTPEVEPDWKTAFSAVMKQRNDWMNRAQNLELDLFLLEEKLKTATQELDSLKAPPPKVPSRSVSEKKDNANLN